MGYDSRGHGNFRSKSFAPVKVGDELDVKIEAVGAKGDGIAKKDGFVLFVPGTKQGDEVKVRITKVLQKVGFAEVAGEKSEQEGSGASEGAESQEAEQSSDSEEEYSEQDSENFGEDNKE